MVRNSVMQRASLYAIAACCAVNVATVLVATVRSASGDERAGATAPQAWCHTSTPPQHPHLALSPVGCMCIHAQASGTASAMAVLTRRAAFGMHRTWGIALRAWGHFSRRCPGLHTSQFKSSSCGCAPSSFPAAVLCEPCTCRRRGSVLWVPRTNGDAQAGAASERRARWQSERVRAGEQAGGHVMHAMDM